MSHKHVQLQVNLQDQTTYNLEWSVYGKKISLLLSDHAYHVCNEK